MITHPEWWIVGMSHEDQLRLVKDYNVILERCYAQNMGGGKYKSNLADNLESSKKSATEMSWSTPTADDGKSALGTRTCGIHAVSGRSRNSGRTCLPYDSHDPGIPARHQQNRRNPHVKYHSGQLHRCCRRSCYKTKINTGFFCIAFAYLSGVSVMGSSQKS